MRILFAITNGDRGGAQEHVLLLCQGLVERGHEVCVLVERPSDLAARLDEIGVTSEPWSSIVRDPSPVRDLAARRELRHTVTRLRPDVLHVHSAKAGVLGRGILVPPHGVTVYTCHHAPFGPGRRLSHRLLARPVEQLTLRYTHGIISVGARDMPMLRRLAPGVPVELVRNAVPAAAPPDLDGPPPEVAVWVARMAHPKDPLQAVKAWEHVVATRPGARLIMVGTGPLAGQLRTAIADSPASGSIDYRGKVPSVEAALAEGSIYLLATQVEGGTTMATLEAMTAGLVPVMSDAGDAFLYIHAGCGVVVPRNAPPTALAAAVVELFSHPTRLHEMRRRAVEFTRAWTVEDMVAATEAVYRAVLSRPMGSTDV